LKHIDSPKPIDNKYDLMHNNTPSYASTVVTWDTTKMSKITFNRVVKWLETGASKFSRGEAAAMYDEIRKRFEIPEYVVRNYTGQHGGGSGYLFWEHATPQLMQALEVVYQTERVVDRMENSSKMHYYQPWYLKPDNLTDTSGGYLYLNSAHDLSEVERCVAEIVNSEEIKAKREAAISFVKSGGKLEFTWR
jgi:hypothetical protein